MKHLTFTLLLGGLLIFTSCGWSDSQKQAAKTAIGDGFDNGLESTGAKVDPKVREAWLDCVIEKGSEKYSFDEFNEAGSKLNQLQEECAKEVGLYDAITME